MLVVFGVVAAAMPREMAPDFAEAAIGVAGALAILPRVCIAIMRLYDSRAASQRRRRPHHRAQHRADQPR